MTRSSPPSAKVASSVTKPTSPVTTLYGRRSNPSGYASKTLKTSPRGPYAEVGDDPYADDLASVASAVSRAKSDTSKVSGLSRVRKGGSKTSTLATTSASELHKVAASKTTGEKQTKPIVKTIGKKTRESEPSTTAKTTTRKGKLHDVVASQEAASFPEGTARTRYLPESSPEQQQETAYVLPSQQSPVKPSRKRPLPVETKVALAYSESSPEQQQETAYVLPSQQSPVKPSRKRPLPVETKVALAYSESSPEQQQETAYVLPSPPAPVKPSRKHPKPLDKETGPVAKRPTPLADTPSGRLESGDDQQRKELNQQVSQVQIFPSVDSDSQNLNYGHDESGDELSGEVQPTRFHHAYSDDSDRDEEDDSSHLRLALAEIAAMGKKRRERKRIAAATTVIDTAASQVSGYLAFWVEGARSVCRSLELSPKLEEITTAAASLLADVNQELKLAETDVKDAELAYAALTQQMKNTKVSVASLVSECKEDERRYKASLDELKVSTKLAV